MSLGVGFKKVIDMTGDGEANVTRKKDKLAWIDDDGVTFKSHLSGDTHRFTPELSMQIQHGIGADITFAFDELTTLHHDYYYQIESLDKRTHPWAVRSLAEHQRLNAERTHRPPQALFGVVQGANYEERNRFWMIWKNDSVGSMLRYSPWIFASFLFSLSGFFGGIWALGRLPRVWMKRKAYGLASTVEPAALRHWFI
jgi:hypothetical protein